MVMGVIGGTIIPRSARSVAQCAQTYGITISTFGLGAVIGALDITEVRKRMTGEAAIGACAVSMGGAITTSALSHQPELTAAALFVAGAVWMVAWALFNIGVQLSVPRWVSGRSLAAYQAVGSGGIGVGSWAWGYLADVASVQTALLISAGLMVASPIDVRLALTGRSALVVEI